MKYYNDHKSEFVRPETVVLREIFVSTEGKPDADIPALRKKADNLRDRVLKNGDDFGDMAKHFSDSSTAPQSGDLGTFERSQLDPKIAEKVFALNHSQMTDVIETKTGFEILQVARALRCRRAASRQSRTRNHQSSLRTENGAGHAHLSDNAAGRQLRSDQARDIRIRPR